MMGDIYIWRKTLREKGMAIVMELSREKYRATQNVAIASESRRELCYSMAAIHQEGGSNIC